MEEMSIVLFVFPGFIKSLSHILRDLLPILTSFPRGLLSVAYQGAKLLMNLLVLGDIWIRKRCF